MNDYELLLNEAHEDDIEVCEMQFSDRIKGLYCDGIVGIKKDMSTNEKACVLAEELGHHYTTVGNILATDVTENRRQERQARIWAYNKKIGLNGLIRAYRHGCRNSHEIAEYLNVTDEFLIECIACYRSKYGACTTIDDYYIMFIPHLCVGKIVQEGDMYVDREEEEWSAFC